MHGAFEELRAAHPGKWLLIRTDGRDSETGTLLFVHEDPNRVGEEMLWQPKEPKGERPLYITYSETEADKELVFVLRAVAAARSLEKPGSGSPWVGSRRSVT